jgi:hypothetical protein
VRKLIVAGMLAAFAGALVLPAIVAPQSAVAAEKKKGVEKTKAKTDKKKKPSGKM